MPSASPRKSGDQSHTISPAVPVLADAIGGCSTRLRGGEGGPKARAALPDRLGTRLWRYGRFLGVWTDVSSRIIVNSRAERMFVTQSRLYASVHAVGSVYTHFCVLVSNLSRPYSQFVGKATPSYQAHVKQVQTRVSVCDAIRGVP